jgi:hypothetical protein
MQKLSILTISAGSSIMLSACAGTPPLSNGERISQRGDLITGYGGDWNKGRDAVAQGRKSVTQSARTLADGRKDLARAQGRVAKAEQQIRSAQFAKESGERKIVEGTSLMQRAEADYAAVKAGPSAVPPFK